MVSIVHIIEKYNPDEDNTFSNEDVLKIAKEIAENERKSLFNNKILIAACAVVAVVSAVDRSFVRMSNVDAAARASDLPPVRHMQEGVPPFTDWLECKAVATVPKSYVERMGDGMAYVCEPVISCEEQVATASPSATVTTATPTKSPSDMPVTASPTESPVTANPTKTPSKNPTKTPSKTPTKSPSKSPTIAPAAQPVAQGCYNTLNFGYKGDIEHSCEWVQRTDFRREVLCTKQTSVREACPVSCGTCCGDNPDFTTDTPYGEQGCDWIGSNPLRKIGYCPVPDVGTYCAETCEKCGPYMSMVPTMFGTTNETSAPTGRLDDD